VIDDYLAVFVTGHPAPQGSKKSLGAGRPLIESSKYVKPWREDIRQAVIKDYSGPVLDEALTVELQFFMPRPGSTPKSYTPYAVKRPDIDKLVRAVLDAISSAGVWADDARVVELYATKALAENDERPGVYIRVRACTSTFLGNVKP
jgi:crossover junction endodeoxyribonuclease RusA